jgi:hypothetical protein
MRKKKILHCSASWVRSAAAECSIAGDGMSSDPRQSKPSALIGEDEIVLMVEEAIAAVGGRRSEPAAANDVERDMATDELPAG